MRVRLQPAETEDAEAIAALRNAVSDDLTFKHGKGNWTRYCTTAAVLRDLRRDQIYVVLHRDEVVASLVLGTTKPPSIGLKYFPKVTRPLFLTEMVVAPDFQRQGVGRACLGEVLKLARRAKAEAIFLGTREHPSAGAGPFFGKCGFDECERATDGGTTLVYYKISV